jgi:hypothetical protein
MQLSVPHVTVAPTLDDVEAERWPSAGRVDGFRQRTPGDGTPESRRTVAFVAQDARNLYVGFRCTTPPGALRARLAPREDIVDDDRVALYLDTFRDQQRAWVFSSNALGVQQDALLAEGEYPDDRFDTVWQTDARRGDSTFVVLMTVPFSSLRFSAGDAQRWGIALGRVSPALSEEVFWPYITDRVEGFTNQMAEASLTGVVTGRNLMFIPYGAVSQARALDAETFAVDRVFERRVGLDAKAVLSAFTIDATLNPDFSQVTPDEPQVTVNQRFEVFFPERRPFFLENADFFADTDQLFFSRRVVDPGAGLRLTGQVGGWTIGALGATDRHSDAEDVAGTTGIGVLRVQRDLGAQSRIALLSTSRRGPAGSNLVVGTDARLKLSATWVLTALAAQSATRSALGERSHGTDVYGALTRTGRGFNYWLSYLDRSPGFDPQLGFVQRVDLREVDQELRYAWYPSSGWLRTIEPVLNLSRLWDHRNRPLDWWVEPSLNIGLFDALDVQLYRTDKVETYEGLVFRQHATAIEFQDAHSARLGINGGVSRGRAVNFDPAVGTRPFLATGTDANIGLIWRPVQRVRLEETYYFTRLALPTGPRVLDNHLSRTTLVIQLSRALSARAIMDIATVAADARYSAEASGTRLTGDVLVTYQRDPFTAIHIGYTDQLENVALERSPLAALRRTRTPRTSTDRQFFIKSSVALRF